MTYAPKHYTATRIMSPGHERLTFATYADAFAQAQAWAIEAGFAGAAHVGVADGPSVLVSAETRAYDVEEKLRAEVLHEAHVRFSGAVQSIAGTKVRYTASAMRTRLLQELEDLDAVSTWRHGPRESGGGAA